jgi:hypothetical protein
MIDLLFCAWVLVATQGVAHLGHLAAKGRSPRGRAITGLAFALLGLGAGLVTGLAARAFHLHVAREAARSSGYIFLPYAFEEISRPVAVAVALLLAMTSILVVQVRRLVRARKDPAGRFER